MIIETFRQAIQNVWSNKLRTFLTMLGIIIGALWQSSSSWAWATA